MNWEKAFIRCYGKTVLSLVSVFFILFFLSISAFAETRELKDISMSDAEDGFKIVITADGPVEDYHIFYFAAPLRMAIDIPGKWDYPGNSVFRLSNHAVKYIVLGEHPKKMRIVVHLKEKKMISPYLEEFGQGLILSVKDGSKGTQRATPGGKKRGRELKEIRINEYGDEFKADIITGSSISSHERFFILDERPKKFVLDLPGKWISSVKPVTNTGGGIVRRVRLGVHGDFLRVVFDLSADVPPTPFLVEKEHGLTVRLTLNK